MGFFQYLAIVFLPIILLGACTSRKIAVSEHSGIAPKELKVDEPSALGRLKGATPWLENKLILDVELMLRASDMEKRKNISAAQNFWLDIVAINHPETRKEALNLWLKSHEHLQQFSDERTLDLKTKEVFLQLENRGLISTLKTMSLNSPDDLQQYITRTVDGFAEKGPKDSEPKIPSSQIPKKGIPRNDPALTATATLYCEHKGKPNDPWRKWVNTLSKRHQQYWTNLTDLCGGRRPQAISGLETLLPELAKDPKTLAPAIHSGKTLTIHHRHNAARKKAADIYETLVAAWEHPQTNPHNLGLSEDRFYLEKINDLLWAARYRGLVGDYEGAPIC
jgi:hypothetical protein